MALLIICYFNRTMIKNRSREAFLLYICTFLIFYKNLYIGWFREVHPCSVFRFFFESSLTGWLTEAFFESDCMEEAY